MAVMVVEILQPGADSAVSEVTTTVVEVLAGTQSPVDTSNVSAAATEVIAPGGTVANVGWGYEFPLNPVEGQIFIKVQS